MQGHNPFAQFQTAGPTMGGQFPGGNQAKPQMNAQFPQFPNQQFPNPQMMQQFQTAQPMNMNMMQNQPGMNPGMNPGINMQQQNMIPPAKPRLIVKLENNERGFYSTMFAQVDPTDLGKVDGKVVGPFMKRSGLPSETLKTIWRMTSSDKKGLDKEEFYVALRLVAYAQNNLPVSEDSIRQNLKVPLPKFNAEVAPAPEKKEPVVEQPTANLLDMGGPSQGMQMNVQPMNQMNQMNQPQQFNQPMGQQMNQQFNAQSFDAFGMSNPTTPSNTSQSTMPSQGGFGSMPNLMDQANIAQQNKPSTQVASSNLLGGADDLLGGGDIAPAKVEQPVVTNTLPVQANIPQANLMEDSVVPTNTMEQSPMRQSTGGNAFSASPNSTASGSAPQEMSDVMVDLTPEYIKQYEILYEQRDPQQKGILTQAEIGDIFFKSGLSNEILFQIWSFCDSGDKGVLDKPEFMLALHLIAMSRRNIRLPATLPPKYTKFLNDMKKKLPSKHFLIEKANAAAAEENFDGNQNTYQESTYQESTTYHEETYASNTYDTGHQGGYNEYNNEVAYEAKEDVPLRQSHAHHHHHNASAGADTTQLLMKMQEHQNELMSTAANIKDSNNRVLAEKREDINRLTSILENCQDILSKLITENDYVQTELVTLDNHKRTLQNSIESVQQQISQQLARQQGLHRKTGGGNYGNASPQRGYAESPQKPHDEFGVDFQKEFAGGWDGFDNNFGDQNQNPNTANNWEEY